MTTTGQRATLWINGSVVDLNTQVTLPGGVILNEATAINDLGQIVANGRNPNGTIQSAYLLTPTSSSVATTVPFPMPMLWVLGLGLLWLSLFKQRAQV